MIGIGCVLRKAGRKWVEEECSACFTFFHAQTIKFFIRTKKIQIHDLIASFDTEIFEDALWLCSASLVKRGTLV